MASTYSTNLKIELQATGENSGTWGTITNTNLGTALEQAVVGYGNPNYTSDANLTLTYTDTNASQTARALVLNVTSSLSLTATRELVVPTIQKQYIVQNNTTGSQSITVKTSAGTGITVPTSRKAHLYVDGTNVIQMFDFVDINGGAIDGTSVGATSASTGAFTTLSATTPIAVTSGGTGQSSFTDGQLLIGNSTGNTLTKSTLTAGSGVTITNSTGSITIAATGLGGDVVGPASSTDDAITRFDATTGKLIQNSVVTLSDAGAIVAPQAGSVIPFYFDNQAAFPSATTYHGAVAHSHADGAMYFAHGGSWTRLLQDGGALGTPSGGTVTNLTGTASININGTVGATTANTGAFTTLTTSSTTTLNGLTASTALALDGSKNIVSVTNTGTGNNVLATSPTLTTPVLGTPTSGNLSNCTADGTNNVGYRNIPQSGSAKTANYDLVVGDVGKFIELGASGAITIPNATFAAGDVLSIFNNTASGATITCTITTAYIAGTDVDKASVTLATRGVATILFISGTVCVISGNVS